MSLNATLDLPVRPAHVESARTAPPLEWVGERVRPLSPLLGHVAHTLRDLSVTAWMALDTLIFTAGMTLGYRLFATHPALPTSHILCWQAVAIGWGALAVAGVVFGLYERETLRSRSRVLTRTLMAAVLTTLLLYTVVYVAMYATISRRAVATAMLVYLVLAIVARMAARWALHRVKRGVVLVGPPSFCESFLDPFAEGVIAEYSLEGYVDDSDEEAPRCRVRRLGHVRDLPAILRGSYITDVVVSTNAAGIPRIMHALLPCLRMGCRVTNQPTFFEKASGQILADEITPQWFLFADLKTNYAGWRILKRGLDLSIATAAFVLTLPLWPLIALAIKLTDGGPVFYSQDRVGLSGSVFRLYKFRTMRVNAENGRSVWATPNDPRVTPIGAVLRRMRLDELPQVYNVLRGDMSVVGPRPERPDFVADLTAHLPYYPERHLVKPGLTGWAQISFRYANTIEDAKRKLQFDLYYIKHMCFELDVIILLRTLGTFLRGAC